MSKISQKLQILFCGLVLVTCSNNEIEHAEAKLCCLESNVKSSEKTLFVGPLKLPPYSVSFEIEDSLETSLIVSIDLKDSYFASPHSKADLSGKFNVSLNTNSFVELDSSFLESPRSVSKDDIDPFVNGPVNWVRVNTSYTHGLKLLKEGDFQVYGMVRFTIEPNCTFEEIPFIIKSKSGKLTVFQDNC
jgi:hypothetical protein